MLFNVHARSIYRKSRADVGKLGVWLVEAPDSAAAVALWRAHPGTGEWVFESITARADACVRLH